MPTTITGTPGKHSIVTRIANLANAWEEIAPEAKFSGMTLAEFKTATASSLDIRTSNNTLRVQRKAGIGAQALADVASRAVTNQVVAAVTADSAYGPNSPLYRAMGFIPKSERKNPAQKAATATLTTTASVPATV